MINIRLIENDKCSTICSVSNRQVILSQQRALPVIDIPKIFDTNRLLTELPYITSENDINSISVRSALGGLFAYDKISTAVSIVGKFKRCYGHHSTFTGYFNTTHSGVEFPIKLNGIDSVLRVMACIPLFDANIGGLFFILYFWYTMARNRYFILFIPDSRYGLPLSTKGWSIWTNLDVKLHDEKLDIYNAELCDDYKVSPYLNDTYRTFSPNLSNIVSINMITALIGQPIIESSHKNKKRT